CQVFFAFCYHSLCLLISVFFFFFQAEDGIRDRNVTGVQTCALPIYLFVVRTAGHVVDTTVTGSIEFGVDLLHTPLVVVLGHHGCGAVGAAADALATGSLPNNFVRAIVDRVIPSLVTGTAERDDADGTVNKDSLTLHLVDQRHLLTEHVRSTVRMLHDYSAVLEEAVAAGECAIVGMEYDLADGTARTVEVIGNIEPQD